ncbi:SMP-30/gluconolactonase/LRE family protein [Aestuariivirga sp.]|uniref:SMP-30/gluconolactonase/LRE family protein n=1 Tax=Aestuariivirga sp. TaxID=2650926 RepID=UPI003BAC8F2A
MTDQNWKIIAQTRDRLGESPMWNQAENALYWVDWYGPTLHRLVWGQEKVESWVIPGESVLGSFVFAAGGRLLLAVNSGLVLFDPATGGITPFVHPEGGREAVLYNDSKIDPFGRLWVGTCDLPETEPRGILYCVSPDGKWSIGDSGYAVCNGPAFSPDGRTLYFSDSMGRRIIAYDLSPGSRQLKNRRLFHQFSADEGVPDGLTVDEEGGLWCAHYGGARVTRFLADGTVARVIPLPCPVTAAVAFGGPDMTTLFIATGWSPGVEKAEDEQGPGGALLAVETGIKGVAEPVFDV